MTIRKTIACISLFLSIGFLSSCMLLPIAGNGVITTDTRNVGSVFDSIDTSGNFEITVLTAQNDTGIAIRTDSNFMDLIESTVKDGTLHVGIKPFTNLLPTEKITITIYCADPVGISNSGTGTLNIPSYSAKSAFALENSGTSTVSLLEFSSASSLNIDSSGTGTITLSGACPTLNLESSGTGDLNGSGLLVADASIHVSGASNVELNASNSITGSFSGVGTIGYTGGAHYSVSSTGIVTIIAR